MEKYLPSELKKSFSEIKSDSFKNKGQSKITEWKDHYMPIMFPAKFVTYAYENWEPRNTDILIATFAKTGTTLSREIVRLLLYSDKPDELEMSTDFASPISYLEAGGEAKYKIMDHLPLSRRYFATHLPPALINMERLVMKGVKILLLIRNPKDQFLSFRKFERSYPFKLPKIKGGYMSEDDDQYLTAVFAGELPLWTKHGEWYFDYLNYWFKEMETNKNIMPVVYENLIKNPAREIRRIAEHIGCEIDDAKVNLIIERTKIDYMKNSDCYGFENTFRKHVNLIQKGGYGGWKDQLTVNQSEAIEKEAKNKLKYDIKFIYE